MRTYWLLLVLLVAPTLRLCAFPLPKPHFSGMYLQWGYNRECFSRSDLHFFNGSQYDFTIHNAEASDKPDFNAIWRSPVDFTIPQYSYRIGCYLNKERTWAFELNFDHAKYVVTDDQKLHITGRLPNEAIDRDTTVTRDFLHFEHTDGANFMQLNYVHQHYIIEGKKFGRLSCLIKGGAGVVIPRTDVTFMGHELNNKFHVAGYILSTELGMRYYPLQNLFFELNVKGGFARYVNALAIEGGNASHHFWYAETIALAGYGLNFGHHRQGPEHSAFTPL